MIDRIKQIMGDDPDVHAIRKESSKFRKHLERDVDGLRNKAQELMDWKHYVRKYPVATIGAAVVLGYLLVPRRSPIVNVADLVPAPPVEPIASEPIAPPRPEPVPEPVPPPAPPHHHQSMVATVGEAILTSTLAFAGQRLLIHLLERAGHGMTPSSPQPSRATENRVPQEDVENVRYSGL